MTRENKGNRNYNENKRTNRDKRRPLPPLPITDAHRKAKDRYYARHKERVSKRNKARYAKNPEKYKEAAKKRRRELYYRVFKIRYDGVCSVCGYDDHRALDFHHVEPADKIDTIAQLCNRSVAWRRIEEELKKCELICSNCHRIEHYVDHRKHDFESRYLQEKGFRDKARGRSSEEE